MAFNIDGALCFYYVNNNNLPEIEKLIKDGCDVNLKCKNSGNTLLMQASYFGYEDIVLFLLQNGADFNLTDNNGETAYQKCRRELNDLNQQLNRNKENDNLKKQITEYIKTIKHLNNAKKHNIN